MKAVAVVNKLHNVLNGPSKAVWLETDPYAVDAIRGTMHELKWRGTLSDYPYSIPELIYKTVERLEPLVRIRSIDFDSIEFPDSSFKLSGIGFGTYGWKYDADLIRAVLDTPIQMIDTAETYGYGKVEEGLGKAWNLDPACHDVMVATKMSVTHMRYQSVISASMRSIKKLNMSRIPLYQIHRPNPNVHIAETLGALERLVNNGVVDYVGVCNFSIDQLAYAQTEFPYKIVSNQIRYNLLDRGVERKLIPWCKRHGIVVMAYSPLGQDWRKHQASFSKGQRKVMDMLVRKYKITAAQITLAWIASKDIVPLPRTNSLDHLREIADTSHVVLSKDDITLLDITFPVME